MMDERLGSLARFERVRSVRQVDHLVIDMSWATVDDTLPLVVQYDKYHRPIVRFSPYAEADEVAPPRECVSLTGEEFLSVLVWLVRQGLLEDVGLVSTETAPSVRATHASPVPVETHSCLCALEPVGEAERVQAIAEWGIEQEMARRESQVHAEQGRGQRLVTMVADETSVDDASVDDVRARHTSVDDVGARHASPVQEGEPDDDDPFGGEYDLVEGAGDPSWLELPTVMQYLHCDQELSVTDIARVCGTTYARVKGALKRLGIERRSYRGGRSKIVSASAPASAAQ